MDKEINDIIYEIHNEVNKTDEWYLKTCDRITNILKNGCSSELRKKILQNCDHIFIVKDCIIEINKSK